MGNGLTEMLANRRVIWGFVCTVVLLVALVSLLVTIFGGYLLYPVHILVLSDRECRGTRILVDGRPALNVTGKGDVLHFHFGLHSIKAVKEGCKPAATEFDVKDPEQGSTTEIRLTCKRTSQGRMLNLTVVE